MKTRTLTRLAALACVGALALAACGSSDSSDGASTSDKTTTTAGDSSQTTTGSGATVVKLAEAGDLGQVLVDADGMTLYTLTDDAGKAVDCTGGCLDAWPPASVPPGTEPTTVGGIEIDSADGPDAPILTADGLPLYTFSGDSKAGDANGDGIASFGGTWHAVKAGGSGDDSGSGSGSGSGDDTTTTESSDSGGMGGY